MNSTFIIPIRIDSEKRLENINLVVNFLLKHTNSKIVVTERDVQRKVYLPENERLKYRFQKMENGIFHRTKILNEMLNDVDTEITINYDADVILNKNSYIIAENMILQENYDLVYPYEYCANNQLKVYDTHPNYSLFKQNLDEKCLDGFNSEVAQTQWGHVQFFKTSSYRSGYMENENFKEYAPEDVERGLRFQKLGYKVGFFKNQLYHLEHPINPMMIKSLRLDGEKLFKQLQHLNKSELLNYYRHQTYYNQYKT
jgi:hypothetical protein